MLVVEKMLNGNWNWGQGKGWVTDGINAHNLRNTGGPRTMCWDTQGESQGDLMLVSSEKDFHFQKFVRIESWSLEEWRAFTHSVYPSLIMLQLKWQASQYRACTSLIHYCILRIIPMHRDTQYIVFQSLSCIWLFTSPWTGAHQGSLSFTISGGVLKLMSIESVMPSNYLILCHPLLFLPSFFPSIRVFSNLVAKVLEFQLQHQSF